VLYQQNGSVKADHIVGKGRANLQEGAGAVSVIAKTRTNEDTIVVKNDSLCKHQ
jgi:hypothetical protein